MRIAFTLIIFLLGINLLVELAESNLVDVLTERRNTIERLVK
ncbi:MAG: hypothetical protein CM15mV17_0060 [Caudoviricetes sp.]|nr:MAG: hypothetical protein CM15mV17_0060 [Caudoviricetes sp.]